METEKMIEETTKDIEEMFDRFISEWTGTDKHFKDVCKEMAILMKEKCYRKVPEGAVVLTREEYEKFQMYERQIHYIKMIYSDKVVPAAEGIAKEIEQARNETKREVLKKLDGFRFVMYDDEDEEFEVASWTCDEDDVKRFAKEIDAE